MQDIDVIINENGLLKTLFHSIPSSVMIIDKNHRVQSVSDFLERSLNVSRGEIFNKSIGEVIRCVSAAEGGGACGQNKLCQDCQIFDVAFKALNGRKVHKAKVKKALLKGDGVEDVVLLVSAAPVEYRGEQLALLMLEDISELTKLKAKLRMQEGFAGLIGQNPRMVELYETIEELAQVDVPVLIQGESGTGKELIATAIHYQGKRATESFVAVNCGALTETLLESELFGHVKGAFTGAIRDKKGRFEMADGGTIFLDELNDISPMMQVKILRVLQEGTFERVGSEKTTKVDVRVISATNKNINKEIAEGRFREDLYYRLCVVPIYTVPLRDRIDDVPLLTRYFLSEAVGELHREPAEISAEALELMKKYRWPGNIRELQNAIKYALVKCKDHVIEPKHLPMSIHQSKEYTPVPEKRRRKRKLNDSVVKNALDKANGNKVVTAKLLGVSRATLYRYMEFSGIEE
ncbi:MAG: sigma-54 interaction domain-containing protein [Candidatus Zhuqueibacterota bacterium]